MPYAYLLFAAAFLAAARAEQQTVYLEADGLVCIEPEEVAGHLGSWKKHTDASFQTWVQGFTGGGCLQFTGNQETSGPPHSPLTFFVKISTPGTYRLAVRGLEAPIESKKGDRANDCYVRLCGQADWRGKFTKCVLLGKSFQWSWNVKSEFKHHEFTEAEYELTPGIQVFQVAGRSKNFFLDRVVLYQEAHKARAKQDATPVSKTAVEAIPPQVLAASRAK